MNARTIEDKVDIAAVRILDTRLRIALERRAESRGQSLEDWCSELLATAIALDEELGPQPVLNRKTIDP